MPSRAPRNGFATRRSGGASQRTTSSAATQPSEVTASTRNTADGATAAESAAPRTGARRTGPSCSRDVTPLIRVRPASARIRRTLAVRVSARVDDARAEMSVSG